MTVLDWIYQSHIEGAKTAKSYIAKWESLRSHVNLDSYDGLADKFDEVLERFKMGANDAQIFSQSIIKYFDELVEK